MAPEEEKTPRATLARVSMERAVRALLGHGRWSLRILESPHDSLWVTHTKLIHFLVWWVHPVCES